MLFSNGLDHDNYSSKKKLRNKYVNGFNFFIFFFWGRYHLLPWSLSSPNTASKETVVLLHHSIFPVHYSLLFFLLPYSVSPPTNAWKRLKTTQKQLCYFIIRYSLFIIHYYFLYLIITAPAP